MEAESFFNSYKQFKFSTITGRMLVYDQLNTALKSLSSAYKIQTVGESFLNIPIQTISAGTGKTKILMWSQMHGNESTPTKGLLDLLNYFKIFGESASVKKILDECSILIIPMLNPDGAARYTRENVNRVDLNRDAMRLEEPESRVLRKVFETFNPDFCFNLHDQRSIFGVGDQNKPAILSFLAPCMDESCSVSHGRREAMQVIAEMYQNLQPHLPEQVGRFDDSFNINCTGDYFQAQGAPTILFECGHYPEDYQREKTREFFTFAVFNALKTIASRTYLHTHPDVYFQIPENTKNFYDVILRKVAVAGKVNDVGIQFSEEIKAQEVKFIPKIAIISPHLSHYGHREINGSGKIVTTESGGELCENDIVHSILLNNEKLSIKTEKIR